MTTPNQMPRRPLTTSGWHKRNPFAEQILSALIKTKPGGWTQKVLAKDDNGAEIVNGVVHDHPELTSPLARNVSHHNVERAAKRWA